MLAAAALALPPALGDARAEPAKQDAKAKPSAKKKAKQASPAPGPQPKPAAMVIDANTGRVLHDNAGDAPRPPASLTKMMTLYILFGEIEQGRLSTSSKITLSARAAGAAPSKLDLEPGDTIEVGDAVKALIVKSANDIAIAVAEHIGGSEPQFARMMTERARQIGMRSTTFRNASGLPDPGQVSTARDMLTLALRLQDDFPQHYRQFAATTFTFRGKTYRSHNALLKTFPGMDGVKTGYTRASGFNLVSSVRTNNKHVVAAVFGGKTAAARNAHMRVLLYGALEQASTERTRRGSQMIATLPPPQPQPAQAVEAAWATEMKKPPAPPPVKVAKVPPPIKAPPPAPAVRPAQQPDAIAQVLAQGDDVSAAETGDDAGAAASATSPRLDLGALRQAMTEAEGGSGEEPGPAQASAAGPRDIANLIRESIIEGAPEGPPNAAAALQAGPAPARPPSTLDSQAMALAAANAAPAAPPRAQFAPAPVGQGFEIQIGAYGTAEEAQAKIDLVRSRAAGLLDGHGGVTLPVQKEERQMFRARFVSFDESAASNTCLELRRLAIDCFVMKAE